MGSRLAPSTVNGRCCCCCAAAEDCSRIKRLAAQPRPCNSIRCRDQMVGFLPSSSAGPVRVHHSPPLPFLCLAPTSAGLVPAARRVSSQPPCAPPPHSSHQPCRGSGHMALRGAAGGAVLPQSLCTGARPQHSSQSLPVPSHAAPAAWGTAETQLAVTPGAVTRRTRCTGAQPHWERRSAAPMSPV